MPSERGGSFVFLHGNSNTTPEILKTHILKTYPELSYMSKASLDKNSIIVARINETPEEFLKVWNERTNDTFIKGEQKKVSKKKKIDLIKLRGHIGVVAQFLMIGSAFKDGDKNADAIKKAAKEAQNIVDAGLAPNADKKTRQNFKIAEKNAKAKNYYQTADGEAKIWTSIYGFLGNGINSVYGVQKDMDNTRLDYAKKLVNKNIIIRHEEARKSLPTANQTKRTVPAGDEPSWMERNSIKFGSAIKFWSKKKLFNADDPNLKLSALLSIAGKVVSLTGLPEDKFELEKNESPFRKLRRQSNIVSSLFDWTSTFSLLMGAFLRTDKEKSNKNKKWYTLFDFKNSDWRWEKGKFFSKDNKTQWFQFAGAVAFAASLYSKAIAPFTVRKLDVDNLMSHTTLAIASGIEKDHAKEIVKLTAQMMQARELPEVHKQGFAATFTNIANRLEKHHDIALDRPAYMRKPTTELAEHIVEKEQNNVVANIIKDKPAKSLSERITAEANAPSPEPSASV